MKKYLLIFLSIFSVGFIFDDPLDPNCERLYADSDDQEACLDRRKFARNTFIERVVSHTGQNIQCSDTEDEGTEFHFDQVKKMYSAFSHDMSNNFRETCHTIKDRSGMHEHTHTELYHYHKLLSPEDVVKIKGIDRFIIFCWHSLCGMELTTPYCETVVLYHRTHIHKLASATDWEGRNIVRRHIKHPYDYYEAGMGEVTPGDVRDHGLCADSRLYTELHKMEDKNNGLWNSLLDLL